MVFTNHLFPQMFINYVHILQFPNDSKNQTEKQFELNFIWYKMLYLLNDKLIRY